MALVDNAWYVDYGNGTSTGYYAVGKWTALTAYAAGQIIRQNAAPAVNSERCFVCIIAGTTLASEPGAWGTTRGAKTAEAAGPTWQECTGVAALNGDASTNTPNWTTIKNTVITLGQVIQRNNGASFQICSTAGTAGNGSEPAFSDTAGTTTADNTATWTSLGVVGNFTGWQAPHARLKGAFTATWGQAGNAFFVASEHAETQTTGLTLTSPGVATALCNVYCVTKTTVPPVSANLTTGASITTTGNSSLQLGGGNIPGDRVIYNGIAMNAGSGANAATLNINDGWFIFNSCALAKLGTTASTSAVRIGATTQDSGSKILLNNTTLKFGHVNDGACVLSSDFKWKNTANAILGSIPTSLFKASGSEGSLNYIEGVDLSALGSGNSLVASMLAPQRFIFKDCKLGASVTVATTPTSPDGVETVLLDCDNAGTNYRTEKYTYTGTQTIETTIVRTGGASNGTTSISWKIVTTANSKWVLPYEALPIAIWNDTTGANVTITLYGIWGGGAVPNNDDIWFDAEYLGSSSTPQATFSTVSKADNLAAGVALSTDTSTWGGSTTKFKMTLTLSAPQPAQKGPIYIYVKAAKASSTFYIDPLAVLS